MSPRPRLGTVIGGYRIVDFLDQGGMGTVYLAEHEILQRTVAFKVLSDELAADESFRARFLRESRLAVRLSKHPSVIQIYDAGEVDGLLYIAMYYVEGRTLQELLREERRLEPKRALAILGQVASALDAAHGLGLVHRDVKPGNILIEQEPDGTEQCYLGDFGLVREMSSRTRLTRTGYTLATLEYAPPEQLEPDLLKGESIDGRADVYSLGCVLFECLAGIPPFGDRDTDAALVAAHLTEPPPPITARRPELPPELDAVIARAMAKARTDRQPTCGQLLADAAKALGRPGPALPTRPAPEVPRAPHRTMTDAVSAKEPGGIAGLGDRPGGKVPVGPAVPARPHPPPPAAGGSPPRQEAERERPAPSPVAAGPTSARTPSSWRALVGAILAAVSPVFPWAGHGFLGFGDFGVVTGFQVPFAFLWDRHADQTPARLGHLVLILAVAAFVLSRGRGRPTARRVVGFVIIAVAVVYWIQTVLVIKGDFGASTGEALKDIGLGVYLAIAGGVLLLLERRKPDRSPALPSG